MRVVVQDKYYLRDLHREIDLYDRKLIHLQKHEVFATETLRDAAVKKMATKRETLVATARSLAASGIEYHESELPRSFRPEGWTDNVCHHDDTAASVEEVAAATSAMRAAEGISAFGKKVNYLQQQALREEESPLAIALGSWQDDLAAYKKRRQKTALAAAI
ncbi:hypothetical protein [Terriglobus roseus]|uniref:Uncharacterized protein n=1 Tax=Terriglobus roseus TaxID=392734 RepID=A0A1G7QPG8_9BACT|nr:hypothetical protein [Terriglobus roseus]SDG00373.1 hypothetical protein SAMN05444167_3947 [Terriglobus roseus]